MITADDQFLTADENCVTADGAWICDPANKPVVDVITFDVEIDLEILNIEIGVVQL